MFLQKSVGDSQFTEWENHLEGDSLMASQDRIKERTQFL
jgi:hypothetical protein